MRPERVVAATTARRAARSGALWGLVFALVVVTSASGYAATYTTDAARDRLAQSFGANPGLAALLGTPRRLDTVAGFVTWRSLGVLSVVGAVWGLLIATRLLRGEEDAGRWELFLAGRTTRRRAAAQAMAGLGVGLAALWAMTAAATLAVGSTGEIGFSTKASLFFATALVAPAAELLAVGVLAGQLAATRRQANGIGGGVLGASFLIRMLADSGSGLGWLRWASPLGWVEELRPLTGSRPLALLPIAVLVAAMATGAVWLAGQRDLGGSVLPDRDTPPPRLRLLSGPIGLTVRLQRPAGVAWVGALAVSGLMFGLVAQSAASAISGSEVIERALERIGGVRSAGAAAYLGVAFLLAASFVAFAAAGQIAAARHEEAEGHLDHLLARPVGRGRWLAGRLVTGASLVLAASAVAGLAGWVGAASQHSGVGLGRLAEAGLNTAPPALFVLGAGGLVYGLRPRLATATAYGLVTWSFLVEFIGSVLRTPGWVLDTSLLTHISPVPATEPNWTATIWLAGLGLAGALVGIATFQRRDLVSA